MIIGNSSSKLLVWEKSMFQNQCKTMPARHMPYHLTAFLFLSEFIGFDYKLSGLRVTPLTNTQSVSGPEPSEVCFLTQEVVCV